MKPVWGIWISDSRELLACCAFRPDCSPSKAVMQIRTQITVIRLSLSPFVASQMLSQLPDSQSKGIVGYDALGITSRTETTTKNGFYCPIHVNWYFVVDCYRLAGKIDFPAFRLHHRVTFLAAFHKYLRYPKKELLARLSRSRQCDESLHAIFD